MSTPSPLADACEAHFPGDYPATLPYDVQPDGDGGLVAFYKCWCDREWTCGWDAESAGWPVTRREAA